jgi:hypothetical protein
MKKFIRLAKPKKILFYLKIANHYKTKSRKIFTMRMFRNNHLENKTVLLPE